MYTWRHLPRCDALFLVLCKSCRNTCTLSSRESHIALLFTLSRHHNFLSKSYVVQYIFKNNKTVSSRRFLRCPYVAWLKKKKNLFSKSNWIPRTNFDLCLLILLSLYRALFLSFLCFCLSCPYQTFLKFISCTFFKNISYFAGIFLFFYSQSPSHQS